MGSRSDPVREPRPNAATVHGAAVDIAAMHGHDRDSGDLEYRYLVRLLVAALGDQYQLGFAVLW